MTEERSEVYCTNCTLSFIATLDLSLSGNHEIICPHCSHVHYRVVADGVVTEDRWRSSAGPIFAVSVSTAVSVSATVSTTGLSYNVSYGQTFLTASWLSRTDLNV